MISPAVYSHRRAELEARIESLIALLDAIDGDPDLEANGDELDCCRSEDELPPCPDEPHYDGTGVAIALRMIEEFPLASLRAEAFVDAGSSPLVYDFRGYRP